jgi:hypothetical protein
MRLFDHFNEVTNDLKRRTAETIEYIFCMAPIAWLSLGNHLPASNDQQVELICSTDGVQRRQS